jgi:hypothetical protein
VRTTPPRLHTPRQMTTTDVSPNSEILEETIEMLRTREEDRQVLIGELYAEISELNAQMASMHDDYNAELREEIARINAAHMSVSTPPQRTATDGLRMIGDGVLVVLQSSFQCTLECWSALCGGVASWWKLASELETLRKNLGLTWNVTQKDMQSHVRKLARAAHPDQPGGSHERFISLKQDASRYSYLRGWEDSHGNLSLGYSAVGVTTAALFEISM